MQEFVPGASTALKTTAMHWQVDVGFQVCYANRLVVIAQKPANAAAAHMTCCNFCIVHSYTTSHTAKLCASEARHSHILATEHICTNAAGLTSLHR